MSGTRITRCNSDPLVTPSTVSRATEAPPPQRNPSNNNLAPADSDTIGGTSGGGGGGGGILDDFACPVCMEPLIDPALTNCDHRFCTFCLAKWFELRGRKNCPSCRGTIDRLTYAPDLALLVEDIVQAHFSDDQKAEREEMKRSRMNSDTMRQLGRNPLETLMTQPLNGYRTDFDGFGIVETIDIQWPTNIPHIPVSFGHVHPFRSNNNHRRTHRPVQPPIHPPPPTHGPVAEIVGLLDRFESTLRESQVAFRVLMEGLTRIDPNRQHLALIRQRFGSLHLTRHGRHLRFEFPNEELGGTSTRGSSTYRAADWYLTDYEPTWMRNPSDWGYPEEFPVRDRPGPSWNVGRDMMSTPVGRPRPGEYLPDEYTNYHFTCPHIPPSPPVGYGFHPWAGQPRTLPHPIRLPTRQGHQWPPGSCRHGHAYVSPQRSDLDDDLDHELEELLNEFPQDEESYFAERPYEYTTGRQRGPRSHSSQRGHASRPRRRRPRVPSGNHILTTEAQNICVVHPDGTETWVDFAESSNQTTAGRGVGSDGSDGDEQVGQAQHRADEDEDDDDVPTRERVYVEVEDESGRGVTPPQEENYEIGFVVHHHCCLGHGAPPSGNPHQ